MTPIIYQVFNKLWRIEGARKFRWSIKNRIIDPIKYQNWVYKNKLNKRDLAKQQLAGNNFPYRPLISIVTPVYNTPIDILNATIESVIEQTYGNWQLCVANGSPESKTICDTLHNYAKRDTRIKISHLRENLGIAGNTNTAIELATGDFVGFLDHDDCLSPSVLFEVVLTLQQYSDADLIYSDEDKLSSDGKKRFEPHFKPAYSPDL